MRAAAALLALSMLAAPAHAQDELGAASRVRDAALRALREAPSGPVLIRMRAELPEGVVDGHGLTHALLAPTLAALDADERFSRAHLGSFAEGDRHPSHTAQRLGYRVLLDVGIRVGRGQLGVSLSSFATPTEEPLGRAGLREPLDMGLRRFVGFPGRVTEDTVDARFAVLPGRGYLTVAAHDLDGDGRVEIVAVHPDEARVFRFRAGRARHRLTEVGRAAWPEDVARTVTPRRRAVATAVPVNRGVVVRLSERVAPIVVTLRGGRVSAARTDAPCPDDRFAVPGGCAQLVDGRDFFDDVLLREGEPYEAAMHFYAFARERFAQRDGGHAAVEALVNPAGRLVLRIHEEPAEGDPADHGAGATGYGTALAMTDLDVDGAAELLLSHAAAEGAGDQLSLLRAFARGGLRVVWRSEVLAGSVWCAAAGDVDGDGLGELIAIEEPQSRERGRARLWVVQ